MKEIITSEKNIIKTDMINLDLKSVMKKQEKNKNINNEEVENSFKVKKHESDYYVVKEFSYHATNSNINFYDVEVYNQKDNKKLEVNFVTIFIIQCCDCHQTFNFKNSLFHYFHFETAKITHCSQEKFVIKSSPTVMLMKSSDVLFKIMLTDSVITVKNVKTDYDFCN